VADIVSALYGDVLRIREPDDPERDRFIMSKGHAALAVYAAHSISAGGSTVTSSTRTPATGLSLGCTPSTV
jgi:transketolase N-terminal domain/subunit